ncbi:MAG: hypothetical protein ACRD1T_09450, partial [Acidimicrobiia bacterium]
VEVVYGPLIVTPADRGSGPTLRCPVCHRTALVEPEWMGTSIACPYPHCETQIAVNPFVIGRPPWVSLE